MQQVLCKETDLTPLQLLAKRIFCLIIDTLMSQTCSMLVAHRFAWQFALLNENRGVKASRGLDRKDRACVAVIFMSGLRSGWLSEFKIPAAQGEGAFALEAISSSRIVQDYPMRWIVKQDTNQIKMKIRYLVSRLIVTKYFPCRSLPCY